MIDDVIERLSRCESLTRAPLYTLAIDALDELLELREQYRHLVTLIHAQTRITERQKAQIATLVDLLSSHLVYVHESIVDQVDAALAPHLGGAENRSAPQ